MTELASRALLVPKKIEDADERADAHYMAHLPGFVSTSAYNDACSSLNLLESPQPLIALLDRALPVGSEPGDSRCTLARAALESAAALLVAARDARSSALPSVRAIAAATPTKPLAAALVERAETLLLPLLPAARSDDDSSMEQVEEGEPEQASRPPSPPPTRLVLATVDAVAALVSVADEDVLATALAPPLLLHARLVRLLGPETADSLQVARTRIADVAVAALGDKERADLWLRGDALLNVLADVSGLGDGLADPVVCRVIVAAAGALTRRPGGGALDVVQEEAAKNFFATRSDLLAIEREKETDSAKEGFLLGAKPANNLSTDAENAGLFESIEDSMHAASEDYAQDVFLRSQLQSALPTRDNRLVIPTTASAVTISRAAAASGKKIADVSAEMEEETAEE